MGTALIGLLGVLVGISINEWLRRRNRIETYAARVFDKRLEIYEELYQRVSAAQEIANDVIENDGYSHDDRHAMVSAGVHSIAGGCDEHDDMYINEEITVLACRC
jgi:xanthosine utilization system XapX-like protein